MAAVLETQTEWLEHLPFTTNAGADRRARIGIVVLDSDYTVEHELTELWRDVPGVERFVSRIRFGAHVSVDSLAAMGPMITETADRILAPGEISVLAYGCTSATAVMGEARIRELLQAARPDAETTSPLIAGRVACTALGARRIAVLTPYPRVVNERVWQYFDQAGFEIPVFGSFNEPFDPTVAAIDTKSLSDAIERMLEKHDADTVFVSCTSIRIAAAIPELEARFRIPITSSNHAMGWHCLRLTGIDDLLLEHGKLFGLPLKD